MNNNREAFLEAVDAGRAVLARPEVAARWDEPSVLAEFSVRGLAGHLVRGALTVVDYLAAPPPEGEPIAPPSYFAAMAPAPDLAGGLQASIRQRGEELAAGGWQALVARLDGARAALAAALAREPTERRLAVFGGQVMRLDDYLLTRIVELLVHTDDLAVSVGVEPPAPPAEAGRLALAYLLEVAVCRSGQLAALRAFSRRERDSVQALRVF